MDNKNKPNEIFNIHLSQKTNKAPIKSNQNDTLMQKNNKFMYFFAPQTIYKKFTLGILKLVQS